jgi:hypothetical protein
MSRYAFSTGPSVLLPWYSQPVSPTVQGLMAALPGVAVRRLLAYESGSHKIELQLDRSTHDDALAEIANALAKFGLDLVQVEITEVVTDTLAGAILGGTGGAAAGATTKNLSATLVAAAIGLVVGAAVGSARETIVTKYMAHRYHPLAVWTFYPMDQPPLASAPAW